VPKLKPGYLIIIPWDLKAIGGVNQVVVNLYDEMAADAVYEPYILINDWSAAKPITAIESGRTIIRCRLRSIYKKGQTLHSAISFIVKAPFEMWRISRLLKTNKIETINFHFPTHAATIFILMRQLRLIDTKIIVSIHGTDINAANQTKGVEKRWWEFIFRNSDAIIGCSNRLTAKATELLPSVHSKSHTIYNGINITQATAESGTIYEDFKQFQGRTLVTVIGTIEHTKGLDTFVDSIPSIANEFPDTHFVIAGRSTSYERELEQQISQSDYSSRIHLFKNLPHQKALALMRLSTVFTLPSRRESFGIVLLEAGVNRVPIVCTEICGALEVLARNSCQIVPSEDPAALAAAVLELLQNPEQRDCMVKTMAACIKSKLEWNQTYLAYNTVAKNLLAEQ